MSEIGISNEWVRLMKESIKSNTALEFEGMIIGMSFKENLKAKIKLDSLLEKIVFTMREPPGRWWLDKVLTQELLDMTDFVHRRIGSLNLYMRPLKNELMEILVFDNELPVYHTVLADVLLRKSPHWKQMFSIRNIKKIMNDHDVIISRGKESLRRLHTNALLQLDLTYNGDDLALLLEDAREGLDMKAILHIQETLDLFFELLDFKPLFFEVLEENLHTFGRQKDKGVEVPAFEHLILFDEENLSLGLRKGAFSPQSDSDLAFVVRYFRGEDIADLKEDMAVFEFLAELAIEKAQDQGGR